MTDFTIIKRDASGTEVLRYAGVLVSRGESWVCLRAILQTTHDLGCVLLKRGDIFTEWFYSDRAYNVFRIEDVDTGVLKGWYCNITRPAHIGAEQVAADDLALDVFVTPAGSLLLLDEEEFAALPLSEPERTAAWDAVAAIRQLVTTGAPPFVP